MNIGPILRAMNHNRTRVLLIVLEIAMTLAIVTNCVNVILAEQKKMSQPSGFDDDNLLRMRERLFAPEFSREGAIDTTIDADLRILEQIPGVRSASNSNLQLWEGGGSSTGIKPTGVRVEPISAQFYYGTKNLIDTLGGRIREGRAFRDGDHGIGTEVDSGSVAIITRDLAEVLFPGQSAVGQSIQQAHTADEPLGEPTTVVGVIERYYNPWGIGGDNPVLAQRGILLPARVGSVQRGIYFYLRCEPGAMSSVMAEAEKRLTAANPGRVFEFESMSDKRGRWFASSKIVVTTLTCIIVTLVAVTTLGILGLTSLSVTERTRQIGTRRALGATRADILGHFLLENWLTTTAGILLGIVAAYALNLFLVSHVTDVKMPWQLLAIGVLALWMNGLLATLPPAMRAARVSPSIATRSV